VNYQLLESAPDAMVLVDERGRIVFVNAQTERLLGYTREELLSQSIEVLVPARLRTAHVIHRARYLEDASPRPMGAGLELYALHKNGSEVPVEISLSPIHTEDGVLVASAIRDITARKKAEADRARLIEERALHAEANRVKDEFLATLSHELRTPLNAIVGWSSMLVKGKLAADDMQRAHEAILRNARLQTDLINDLLDVSRIVNRKLQLDLQLVELGAVLRGAVEVLASVADAKGLTIRTRQLNARVTVWGDPVRLQQVFTNLLSNAVKFTPPGGLVSISIDRLDGFVDVRVEDNGIGMDPDLLPLVFDAFRQRDASSTRRHSGLGLGLAIVRHLVEAHGGTVGAQSAGPGKGAAFVVRLPVRISTLGESLSRPGEQGDRREPVPTLGGLSVLLVDDDREVLETAAAILRSAGASVVQVPSAKEAIVVLQSAKPDVLVIDLAMPEVDGYSLLRQIRQRWSDKIPAIAFTAYARDEDRLRSAAAGFQMHLAKPVDADSLVRAVDHVRLAEVS
jgi:PAS domain S-box-containing protein